jgi:ubiquinone/menaquinone biosynthesis C-methylase UbiE
MKKITHKIQMEKWEEEHKKPNVLKMMDKHDPSGSVEKFFIFLKDEARLNKMKGLEMCCGKGRNAIYLARQKEVEKMFAFDFSKNAIKEAKIRSKKYKSIEKKMGFKVADATITWPYKENTFDFVVDCTGITDIENGKLRGKAIKEVGRVLKPGGFLLVYVMSDEDEYHLEQIKQSPGQDVNSFIHPLTNKYEKVFSVNELDEIYRKFTLVKEERIEKYSEFFGKKYFSKMHWRVYQKPIKKIK